MLTEQKVTHLYELIKTEPTEDVDYMTAIGMDVYNFLKHFDELSDGEEPNDNYLAATLIRMYTSLNQQYIKNNVSAKSIHRNLVNAQKKLYQRIPQPDELFTLVQDLGITATAEKKFLWYNYVAICHFAQLDFQMIYNVIVGADKAIHNPDNILQ